VAQTVLGTGAWLAGLPAHQSQLLHVFAWSLTQTMFAIWVEPRFGFAAVACGLSFLVAAARPALLYPAMALDNALFTLLIVRVWIPRDDVTRIMQHRAELRRRARRRLEKAPPGGAIDSGDAEP